MQQIIVLTTHGPKGTYKATQYIGPFEPEELAEAHRLLETLDLPNLTLEDRPLSPLEDWVPSQKGGDTE